MKATRMPMVRILIADDDLELCELLAEYLGSEGFIVDCVHDGEAAVTRINADDYALMVLDIMMPKMNGFDALREVRTTNQTPVLMLTARGDDVDRIVGLEMGADDYLSKPCNPRELVARIRAILRRVDLSKGPASEEASSLSVGDVTLESNTRQVFCKDTLVELTSTEFSVLALMMRHAGEVVTKKKLTEDVLDRKLSQYDRSIDMHVSNLRRKLDQTHIGDERIKTVRGVGYLFVKPNPEDSA